MPDDTALPQMLTLQELMGCLKVSRWTVYRLITSGYLPAVKIQGQWRFKLADVRAYIAQKLTRYGTLAKRDWVFNPDVLRKYRQDAKKYYLHDEAFHGRVGNKVDYYLYTRARSQAWVKGVRKVKPAKEVFYELHYREITLPDGRVALIVSRKDFQNLPQAEQTHWLSYVIDSGIILPG